MIFTQHSLKIQYQRRNKGQLAQCTQQTNNPNTYHMTECTHVIRRPCISNKGDHHRNNFSEDYGDDLSMIYDKNDLHAVVWFPHYSFGLPYLKFLQNLPRRKT